MFRFPGSPRLITLWAILACATPSQLAVALIRREFRDGKARCQTTSPQPASILRVSAGVRGGPAQPRRLAPTHRLGANTGHPWMRPVNVIMRLHGGE